MQMEAHTSLYRALEYIESFQPSFGLMMSLHEQDLHKNDLREKDPKKKGFVVCDPQATNRSDFIKGERKIQVEHHARYECWLICWVGS